MRRLDGDLSNAVRVPRPNQSRPRPARGRSPGIRQKCASGACWQSASGRRVAGSQRRARDRCCPPEAAVERRSLRVAASPLSGPPGSVAASGLGANGSGHVAMQPVERRRSRLKASATDCCSCLLQQQFDGVAGCQINSIVSCDPASILGWRVPEFRALHGRDRDPADLLVVGRRSLAASAARRISPMSATRATCWGSHADRVLAELLCLRPLAPRRACF